MIESIITGVGLGIVLSFATGPVFFALIKTSIERGFYAGLCLAAGVVMCDLIYVSISIYGTSFLRLESRFRLPIGLTGATVLIAIGIYYLLKKIRISYDTIITKRHYTGYFVKGFLMCIFNPGILLYWVTVTGGIVSAVSGRIRPEDMLPVYASILVTQFSMDAIKAYYASKLRYRIKERTLTILNRIAGMLMLVFALKLVYNLVFTHSLL
ncbi:LysE family translocator [Hufsiella ginkgonis]|uniref:LysE family transporter n=1 Tax=Hufsiella ginkgonis TaxID=2695274 RepID=A0A7K1Y3A2_9SPHI|nr:LysE family translocator [Hufsiella ginkgonis]MXV17773.1 LysE family transporter [Hufsiella ginkgonis]